MLNNNHLALRSDMENTCNKNMPDRRRRYCSVVAPELGVEYTKNGERTVVVGNARKSNCCDPTRISSSPVAHRLKVSIDVDNKVVDGLTRHNSLPRRAELRRVDQTTDLRSSTLRATFCQRVNSCDELYKRSESELISRQLLPMPCMQRHMKVHDNAANHLRVPSARPALAVNLAPCHSHDTTGKADAVSTRRTQRSMSAHSVALPGPDSTVLRDPVTGKMYKRGKLLGKGGFAKVYEGLELSTSKKFALKIIDKSRISKPPQREKVDAEIELHAAASEIGHPNVASFETTFENTRVICLVLELCGKKSLAQHLRRQKFLSEAEVSDLTWQIVCGVAHIHGCGLLHRDLKLGNILLSDDMTVKIGDFGLASRAAWGKRKTICGTPNFIAPEVLQRHGHGPESDVWAIGCILFTLLVGKPPFETTSLKETYKCILKNSYRIPSTVSAEAADLLRWMLRSKPHARPTLHDVLKHVFFVKHQTHLRFPGIEELAEDFPCKEISPDSALPLRRKSVLPRLTVHNQSSCSSSYSSGSGQQIRHNSCPSDPCSAYSTVAKTVTVRNDSTSSSGPKISILDHMKQVAAVEENHNVSSKTCVEEVAKTPISAVESDMVEQAMDEVNQENSITCESAKDTSRNHNGNDEKVCNTPTITTTAPREENIKTNAKCNLEKISRKPTKSSPVKFLASKLQKFKIPSPISCMKAAANTMKTRSSDCKPATASQVIPTKLDEPEKFSQATWITKWVDYSNKYGFGYQLADGSICVLFNDGAHIALLSDGKTVEYYEPDSETPSKKRTFSIHSPPPAIARPVRILQHFTAYMDKNLKRGNGCSRDVDPANCESVRMLTWSRTSNHVAMYLSNGTLQVNFCDDHTKINLSNIHKRSAMAVTYVDENKDTSVYKSHQLANVSDNRLRQRLLQVHKEFHLLLGEDDCISHPFCSILRDNATDPGRAFELPEAMVAVV